MDLDEIICDCLSITSGDIKKVVDDGASTLEEVQELTEVGTVCGACIDRVQSLIELFVSMRHA